MVVNQIWKPEILTTAPLLMKGRRQGSWAWKSSLWSLSRPWWRSSSAWSCSPWSRCPPGEACLGPGVVGEGDGAGEGEDWNHHHDFDSKVKMMITMMILFLFDFDISPVLKRAMKMLIGKGSFYFQACLCLKHSLLAWEPSFLSNNSPETTMMMTTLHYVLRWSIG